MERFALAEQSLTSTSLPLESPGAGEVVVEVAGVGLGWCPEASISGTVVEAGPTAAHWLGRRVVVPALLPCGECEACRRGRAAHCPVLRPRQGLATHERVPCRFLVSVEEPLWPKGAELWELALVPALLGDVYQGLARVGIEPGTRLVVIGAGARALLAERLGQHLGARVERWAPDVIAAQPFGTRVIETSGRPGARRIAAALGAKSPGAVVGLLAGIDGPDAPVDAGRGSEEPALDGLAVNDSLLLGTGVCHPELLSELLALTVRGVIVPRDHVVAVTRREAAQARASYLAGERARLPILRLPTSLGPPGQSER